MLQAFFSILSVEGGKLVPFYLTSRKNIVYSFFVTRTQFLCEVVNMPAAGYILSSPPIAIIRAACSAASAMSCAASSTASTSDIGACTIPNIASIPTS